MVVCAALVGCVIPPPPRDTYSPPPESSTANDVSTLHVYRPRVFMNPGKSIHIHIDNKEAAQIRNGGSVAIDVSADTHIIEAFSWISQGSGLTVTFGLIGGSVERNFLAGESYYLRSRFDPKNPNRGHLEFVTEDMYRSRR